jgi:hypothetical protein
MPMLVHANITALLDTLTARDEDGLIRETLTLLGPERVPPAKIAARVGIPAAWGDGDGHALSVLSAAGRVAEWMRAIPLGPEPGAEERRQLASALPLAQGFLAVADGVRLGLPEPHSTLPQGIPPADVNHPDGPLGALREALAARDLERARAILMGYYATGVDYRALLTLLYAALAHRYPDGGHPLTFVASGSRVLDMADWGDRVPAYIYWLTPLILSDTPDTAAGQAAQDYATDAGHDLGWLRKRLSIPKEEAAGPAFQQALIGGDARAACDAVLQALRGGATPIGIASGMALAAAERINSIAPGDREGLLRAGHVLLYINAVHTATTQTQDPVIWPLLYTAACAVNTAQTPTAGLAPESGARATASVPVGGLIAATMLRNFEQQLTDGDTASALMLARRYLQMGHPARALAGVIGAVGATRDVTGSGDAAHTLPLVAAAAEEYMNLPQALQGGGQNALLTASVRLAAELSSSHTLADRARAAINARL